MLLIVSFKTNNCIFGKEYVNLHRFYGSVAQLYRASDSGSECRGLESRRSH